MLCNFPMNVFLFACFHKCCLNERTESYRRAGSPILSILFDWHGYASMVKALRSHYRHKSYHTTWMAPVAIIILHFMPRYTKIWIIINLDLSLEPLHFSIVATRQFAFPHFHCCSCFLFKHRSVLSRKRYHMHAM